MRGLPPEIKQMTVFIQDVSSAGGRAIAETLARAGSRLILASDEAKDSEEIAAALRWSYRVEVFPVGLKNNSVNDIIATLPEAWRTVDFMVVG